MVTDSAQPTGPAVSQVAAVPCVAEVTEVTER